jgi:phosphoglucosamine mutase
VANAQLTPEYALALGRAAARVLGGTSFLVGRDTRISGPLLQAALTAGLAAEGARVVDIGVLPTPALAALAADRNVPAAVISASHNPFSDNGIKLFAPGGRKLSDDVEAQLEAELERFTTGLVGSVPEQRTGAAVGTLNTDTEAGAWYGARLTAPLDGRRLDGVRLVLDCANGAASGVAPGVFRDVGASVDVLAAEPDGVNINDGCGSTHPDVLQARVIASGADVGLAFDGDADRVIAVDHRGRVVDGDAIIALFAADRRDQSRLAGGTVVVTVMSNLGFRQAMQQQGIAVHETAVGDRYVLEALEAHGWTLGGEQSGHIIFRDLATTGDGILTGLLLVDLVLRAGRPLAELADASMTRLPQVLRNVRVADRDGLTGSDGAPVRAAIERVTAELGDRGRVLLRPSGTEPLIRVMAEAPTEAEAEAIVDRLCQVVADALGPS